MFVEIFVKAGLLPAFFFTKVQSPQLKHRTFGASDARTTGVAFLCFLLSDLLILFGFSFRIPTSALPSWQRLLLALFS
jgi:hypothetical protein